MTRAKTALLAAALAAAASVGMLVGTGGSAKAAPGDVYEYGYIVGVPRMESYDIDVSRWGGTNQDKDYLKAYVFAYEQGQTRFSDQVNSLRKLNELSAQGWEVADMKSGLIRRKK
ncbi:MAG: hypothetical protein HS108_05750 [Planctomycetes bacterium]|jgi:hypothetical protein|nr:hypothetical protein [Planctomycetota bacterium]MCL4730184.1 hypothetical protein [Planctomycetota bacterium]